MLNKKIVMKQLEKVIDPEIGIPITVMKLIDKVEIDKGNVIVTFHLTSPFCPMAEKIADDIKSAIKKLKEVKSVKLVLTSK